MTLIHKRNAKNANLLLKGKNRCILSDLYSFIFSTIPFENILRKKYSPSNCINNWIFLKILFYHLIKELQQHNEIKCHFRTNNIWKNWNNGKIKLQFQPSALSTSRCLDIKWESVKSICIKKWQIIQGSSGRKKARKFGIFAIICNSRVK